VTIKFLTLLIDVLVVFFETTAPMTLSSSDNKFKKELPSDDDDDEEAEERIPLSSSFCCSPNSSFIVVWTLNGLGLLGKETNKSAECGCYRVRRVHYGVQVIAHRRFQSSLFL
jgi:hypothetical protein